MQLTFLTDSEIFLRLNDIASKKGIKLRLIDKKIFVYTLHLCELKGRLDNKNNLYFVQYSILTLSNYFKVSTSTMQISFKALCSCDVIKRVPCKRAFKKKSSKSYCINTPYLTYIDHNMFN